MNGENFQNISNKAAFIT